MTGRLPLAALALLLAAADAAAKDIDMATVRRVSRPGAFSADLRGKGQFRVPKGYRFVTEDKLEDFSEALDYPLFGDEVGILLPEEGKWLAVVTLPKSDPLAGADPKQISPDSLKVWQERYAADRRPRKGPGMIPIKVMGWTHPPAYDAEKKRLTMGVRLEAADGGQDMFRHQTFLYGADGVCVCLEVLTTVGNLEKPVAEAAKLATEFTLPQAAAGEPAEDPMTHYAKIGGGGLIGAVAVAVLFRAMAGRPGSRPPARRPGLPR